MFTMRDHRVDDYAGLADIDATDVGVLTEDDQDCLAELGQYLVLSGAWQRFAVWLLHKHFEPAAGEVFVERVVKTPPQTHTTPIERAAFSPIGLSATAMRFDPDTFSGVGLVGMEFAGPADFGPVARISDADETVLAGLAQRLHSHGKKDRFGVRLIRNQLGVSENQLLSEICDKPHRALHCAVIDRISIRGKNSVETSWKWKPVITETGPTVTMKCQQSCDTACIRGSDGHSSTHPIVHPTDHE